MVDIVILFASWLLVFLVVGAIWYTLDRALGTRVYRWIYAMTHRDPLPAQEVKGFIHGQKAKMRFMVAVVLSIAQSALVLSSISIANPFAELMSFFLQIPVVMLGFYLGPWIYRVWERKEDIFDKVDRIESGELSIGSELKQVTQKAAGAVREVLQSDDEPAPAKSQATAPPPEKKQEPQPAPSPWELMAKYLRRK